MYNYYATALLLFFCLLVLAGSIALSYLLFKRALISVVNNFRKHNALEEKNARTLAELGLRKREFWDNLRFQLRDYKPYALQMLVSCNIVCITSDGKYYLSEEKLAFRIPFFQEQFD